MPPRKAPRARATRRPWRLLAGLLLAAVLPAPAAADPAQRTATPAVLQVTGAGWWQNRELRVSLERLLGEQRGATLAGNAVEDAAFLLLSSLQREGYLKPVLTARLTRADGTSLELRFDGTAYTELPRPLSVTAARFHVDRGVRYRFASVQIAGLHAMPEATGRAYFRDAGSLVAAWSAPSYSPGRLRQGLTALQDELRLAGYAEATVTARSIALDDRTGHVDLVVDVAEGPRWQVASLRLNGDETQGGAGFDPAPYLGRPWSAPLMQDIGAALRRRFYRTGHPDVAVRVTHEAAPEQDGRRAVAVAARVRPGAEVRLGPARFEGNTHTRTPSLARRVRTREGALLDPLELEQARYRLARLGVFESVDLRYEPADGPVRSPVFTLREGRRWDASLLFGYGSYEQVRAGIELRHLNLFGRAQQSRLALVQSVKSSRGDYSYTVPGLVGDELDGTVKLFGLRREELSFLRQEYGGTLEFSRQLPWFGALGTLGYTYQTLRSDDSTLATRETAAGQVNAASIAFSLTRDRRDNVLRPHQGYRWFLRTEVADKRLGGEVDFQRIEFGGSWHHRVGNGRWVHLGLGHGVVTTFGAPDDRSLPVNKRFFPGGENSLRGYTAGEASPRDAAGLFTGAKTFTLLNLELEQAISKKWSVVLFSDALGIAARLARYPFDEQLYSIGLGVRYQTLIGPVRLEYGHNLNPRPLDPRGTLQFSLGFPF